MDSWYEKKKRRSTGPVWSHAMSKKVRGTTGFKEELAEGDTSILSITLIDAISGSRERDGNGTEISDYKYIQREKERWSVSLIPNQRGFK